MVNDKHVIEALGKSKVTIENGIVTNVEMPNIDYCPIFGKYHKIDKLTPEFIKKNIQYRIDDFGMCTKDRKVKLDDMLSVGISEILRSNVKLGYIDCVVGACEGVGTLLMTDPDIIQGVGGRVSGLISTTPIPEVIEKVGKENVLFPETAELNPLKGIDLAIERGYKNIAVTVLAGSYLQTIREHKIPSDVNLYLFIAHTTGISAKEAKEAFKYGDIVTACASKHVVNQAEKIRAYYYGNSVSIYTASEKGHEFLDNRLKDINKPLSINKYPQDKSLMSKPLI
ncbi:methanogenesis marker 8 protein [Methanosphaera sp.]